MKAAVYSDYAAPVEVAEVAKPELQDGSVLIEVRAASLRHGPHFDGHDETTVAGRWRANRFLYKWLRYCLHQGHRFEDRTTAAVL